MPLLDPMWLLRCTQHPRHAPRASSPAGGALVGGGRGGPKHLLNPNETPARGPLPLAAGRLAARTTRQGARAPALGTAGGATFRLPVDCRPAGGRRLLSTYTAALARAAPCRAAHGSRAPEPAAPAACPSLTSSGPVTAAGHVSVAPWLGPRQLYTHQGLAGARPMRAARSIRSGCTKPSVNEPHAHSRRPPALWWALHLQQTQGGAAGAGRAVQKVKRAG